MRLRCGRCGCLPMDGIGPQLRALGAPCRNQPGDSYTRGQIVTETIVVRRLAHLPGVEILEVDQTAREWRWFNTAYGVAVSRSWHCDVVYRGRRQEMVPGMVFCSEAGELH